MLLNALAAATAKVASASTVAKVAAGLGIAVTGVTGAGAAGVLPGPVQDGVAGAIEAVTPFDVPDSADVATGPASRSDDAPSSPATSPVVATTAAPTSTSEPATGPTAEPTTEPTEVEAGDDDGVHQHRGGRADTAVAVPTDDAQPTSGRDHAEDDGPAAPPTVDTPEVEDDHGGDDGGHHGGDGSGRGDSSGHGGGDD